MQMPESCFFDDSVVVVGANQYYANSQEVQSYEQHQQPRRPSDSNNSTDNNYYNGMGALNIPPPVPARRVKPPLGTVSGVQQPSNNDQTRTGKIYSIDWNRTGGTLTSSHWLVKNQSIMYLKIRVTFLVTIVE